jgi:hypothetical protein
VVKPESEYTPWPSQPTPAKLIMDGHHIRPDLGYFHFIDCEGHKQVIWVTKGDDRQQVAEQNIWHVEETDTEYIISPSIHFVGHFHTGNPVRFKKVDDL